MPDALKIKSHRRIGTGVKSPSLFRDFQLRSAVFAVSVCDCEYRPLLSLADSAANRAQSVPKYLQTISPENFPVNGKLEIFLGGEKIPERFYRKYTRHMGNGRPYL